MGHGGEFWQNVLHWRREWQTTSVFLPWEPHEQFKRQKDMTLKDEFPRSVGVPYELEKSGEITQEEWTDGTKQKQCPLVDVTGDGNKVRCCKECYCTGTWNVRFMNQGKLKVVKQEMARVNINILEGSELKWTGMGEFNPNDHYVFYRGWESFGRNGVALIVNKRVQKCTNLVQSQKQPISLVYFQAKHSTSQ